MNENESSRGLVAGELERIARATDAARCTMCDLYEVKEQRLRQNVRILELQYADLAGRMDEARRWKSWCLTAALVLIVVVGGLAVKP